MELARKQLELLTQALPGKTKAGARYDAVSIDQFTAAEQAAESIGLKLHGLELENPPFDFDAAFRVLAQDSPDMLLVLSSAHSGGFNVLRRVFTSSWTRLLLEGGAHSGDPADVAAIVDGAA